MAHQEGQPIVIEAAWQHHSWMWLCRADLSLLSLLSLLLLTDPKLVPYWQTRVSRETSESNKMLFPLSKVSYQQVLIFYVQHVLSTMKRLEGGQLPQLPWQHLEWLWDVSHLFPRPPWPIHMTFGEQQLTGRWQKSCGRNCQAAERIRGNRVQRCSSSTEKDQRHKSQIQVGLPACTGITMWCAQYVELGRVASVLCSSSAGSKAEAAFKELGNRKKMQTPRHETSFATWQAKCNLAGQGFSHTAGLLLASYT